MRRLMLIAIATVSLAMAGAAGAKTVAVTITKNGYVPKSVSISAGDSVQFTNSDTLAHQIVFKTTMGVSCVPNPLVLQPTQSGTCTFQAAGKFAYSDPNAKGNTFRGTVTLTGTLSNHRVGENVDALATPCGQTAATKATTVGTTTGGAFTAVVLPLMNTVYAVKVKSTTSPAVAVKVRPRLGLRKLAPRRYSLRVFAAASFAGKYATFQRYNGTLGRWIRVKRIPLRANGTGVAPTVLSSVAFRSAIKPRLKIRVILPQLQVGSCLRPGRSNVIRS